MTIRLLEGAAEIFGEELLIFATYEFEPHCPLSIFTWNGAKLEISYKDLKYKGEQPGYVYNEEEYPYCRMMQSILKVNHILEIWRQNAMKNVSEYGPRTLIIGSKASGKNTLCKTLLNYSVVYGWKPIFVDLDPDQQVRPSPGTITTEIYQQDKSDKPIQRLSYYYGHIYYEQIKESSSKLLYQKLVDQLGCQVILKLEADLVRMKENKKHFLSEYSQIPDQQLCEQVFMKYQEDRDEKEVYASGVVVNCPTLIGHHGQIVEQLKSVIRSYQINVVICIDMPDIFRDLDRMSENTQILVHKLEKLRGTVVHHQAVKLEDNLSRLQSILSSTYRLSENQFHLYELQQRDDNLLSYLRSQSKSVVRSVVGVLHLKQLTIAQVEEDKTLQKQQREQKISDLIFQSPLAFLAYIDSYDKDGYLIQIPNKSCCELLQNNICVFGR